MSQSKFPVACPACGGVRVIVETVRTVTLTRNDQERVLERTRYLRCAAAGCGRTWSVTTRIAERLLRTR